MYPFSFLGGSSNLGLTIAQTHYNRVTAAGGVLPIGVSGLASVINSIATAYGVTTEAGFNTAVPVFLDPHYTGYKLGAGSGTTLGQAAQTVFAINSTADVTQATAASQPLLLAHSGVNYLYNSGVADNYCSTPNSVANQITGSFDISVYASALDWAQDYGMLQSKYATSLNGNYYFCTRSGKRLEYGFSNGVIAPTSLTTINTPFANNTGGWLKVSHNTATGNVSFFYSNDLPNTSYNSINWTLLESIASVIGARNNFNTTVEIGSNASGQNNLLGKVYRATISNTIGGTPVVDFNPNSYNAATSQTQWTSTTGEVWTLNVGTATTGYKGVLVDRTISMLDGVDDTLSNSQTTTFRTTFAAVEIHRTGSFFAGVLNNNLNSSNAASQWFYTIEGSTQIDANNVLSDTIYVNNSLTATYTAFRLFVGQIDLGATPNTANGRLIGYLGANDYMCGIFNSAIQLTTNPDSTQRTAMYNVIKSMNNL
jgi:hypothetical protein